MDGWMYSPDRARVSHWHVTVGIPGCSPIDVSTYETRKDAMAALEEEITFYASLGYTTGRTHVPTYVEMVLTPEYGTGVYIEAEPCRAGWQCQHAHS